MVWFIPILFPSFLCIQVYPWVKNHMVTLYQSKLQEAYLLLLYLAQFFLKVSGKKIFQWYISRWLKIQSTWNHLQSNKASLESPIPNVFCHHETIDLHQYIWHLTNLHLCNLVTIWKSDLYLWLPNNLILSYAFVSTFLFFKDKVFFR